MYLRTSAVRSWPPYLRRPPPTPPIRATFVWPSLAPPAARKPRSTAVRLSRSLRSGVYCIMYVHCGRRAAAVHEQEHCLSNHASVDFTCATESHTRAAGPRVSSQLPFRIRVILVELRTSGRLIVTRKKRCVYQRNPRLTGRTHSPNCFRKFHHPISCPYRSQTALPRSQITPYSSVVAA